MKLSVVIITYNEERNLSRCLESVQSCADEIVIVDSYSVDKTVSIAESFKAKIVQKPFADFVSQKNFADAQAGNDWVLNLDADEALTPKLAQSILQVKESPGYEAYELRRLTNYCGAWIKHCGWYPDKKVRLYNRNAGAWKGDAIHEAWSLYGTSHKTGSLEGDLLHYSYYTYSDHIRQIEKYSEIAARAAVKSGKKVSWLKWFIQPSWVFFNMYIMRLGFLDGRKGYMVCKLSSWAAFIKYSKIRQYTKEAHV